VLLENGDLRYLQDGPIELVRRVFVSVRDVNWNEIAGERTQADVELGTDRFRVRYGSHHRTDEMDLEWKATIESSPDGTITFAMDGAAHREFRYCRVGFCVLHPVEHHACSRFVARTPQGPFAGHLPLLVAPAPFEEGLWHPLFPSFSELTIRLPDYGTVTCAFEGDLFEREDQRNWFEGAVRPS
jgi:hypothetical protein